MTKNGSSGAKARARGRQDRTGSNYTTARRTADSAVCGRPLDPWTNAIVTFGDDGETCARPPHPESEPCSAEGDFDVATWRAWATSEEAAERARWNALTPERQAQEEEQARQEEHDDIMLAERTERGFDKDYSNYED